MNTATRLAVAFGLSSLVVAGPFAQHARPPKSDAQNSRAAAPVKSAPAPPMARIVWLEPIPGFEQATGQLARYRPIPPSDARLADYERFIDTEAGRFARRLVHRAAVRFGIDPVFKEPVLPIVVRKGGNHGAYALAIERAGKVEEHPNLAYVILDPSPAYLGDTILHETGHLVHSLAAGRRGGGSPWTAFPHTTFAVGDPLTALAEGYGIHLETLWGHYGNDAAKQAYYHRWSPSFDDPGRWRETEYFAPVVDLMNFAQVWARYQSIRDGLPAFEGHVYPAAYARSQMDPSRDRARLKTGNAMLASEGVAAAVMFWTAAAVAQEQGARPGAGLDQPALVDAEMKLLEAFAALPAVTPDFRPDSLDLVAALRQHDTHAGDLAIARFVDLTRGVTARPAIRAKWRTLYANAILMNRADTLSQIAEMEAERSELLQQARKDIATLRAGVGPLIAVRAAGATFELKALEWKSPVEFDLNAMAAAEIAVLPNATAEIAARIDAERDRAPFASAADFAARTRLTLEQLGLTPVEIGKRRTSR